MSQLKIDERTLEEILEQMRAKAAAYTPEWRFDLENKDAGTALAVIYAEMLKNTINRLNNVPDKNKIAFYNKIGADIKPAIPSEGYVTFGLINDEVSGTQVPKNTQLFADVKGEDRVVFETTDDVYVSNAKPQKIFVANHEKDYIGKIYDSELDEEKNVDNECEIRVFDCGQENLQKHYFTISHPSIMNIITEGEIIIDFKLSRNEQLDKVYRKAFLDEDNLKFEYLTENGYREFKNVKFERESLVLQKTYDMDGFAELEEENNGEIIKNNYIRCCAKDISVFKDLKIDKIYIRSRGKMIKPELVVAGDNEYKGTKFFAFGERPSIMQEMYFVSEEVLSKKGAFVHLNFDLEYGKFEIENSIEDPGYDWKTIMKKSDFKVDPDYDITISKVVWEYYNGIGWTRLFQEELYEDIFNADSDAFKNITVNFQCPKDIQPFIVNSVTSYSIRARIIKMNNLFKMKGYYISPCISRVRFKYEYIDNTITPYELKIVNNLEKNTFNGAYLSENTNSISIFEKVKDEKPTVYLGFSKPLIEGPLKIMIMLANEGINNMPVLEYQYWDGKKWNNLNLIDETENFRKTGILTMMGNDGFTKKSIFGEDLFWIKILDINNAYKDGKNKLPVITAIHMNTTKVRAVETMEPEYFDIRSNEENFECNLLGKNINSLEVWVDEKTEINDSSGSGNIDRNDIIYDYTTDGEVSNIWIKWREVSEFDATMMDERVYTADYIHGIVRFSDGRRGKIPPSGNEPTIMIKYSCGGGKVGNVSAGQINKLNRTIGFIGDIKNYDRTIGGCDQENIEESITRNALKLRHGYRAVTATDYENLAMEASRNIIKAKCCSNYNINGEKQYGHITLVLLQRDYSQNNSYFNFLREQVKNYMRKYMNEILIEQERFKIIEPEYIVINVNISIVIKDYNKVFEVKDRVDKCITNYLNPINGNFDKKGWNIGECPNESQIQNSVKDILDISFIKNVRIDAYRQSSDGKVEIDYETQKKRPFVLPVSGEHKINIDIE